MFFSGERLKVARKCTFKTIENLIQTLESQYNLKINKGMVSRWENGKATPRYETIKTLAECLNVPIDYLIGRENMGSYMIDERLLNKMTVEDLNQKTGIAVDAILQAEADTIPLTVNDLKKIGKAYGNENFVRSILKKAVSNMFPLVNQETEQFHSDTKNFIELDALFEPNIEIVYKNRLLNNKEQEKLKKVIEALLS